MTHGFVLIILAFLKGVALVLFGELPMSQHALVDLIATITKLFFAIYVFEKNPRNAVNRLWSLLILCLVIWGFGEFILRVSSQAQTAEVVNRISRIGFCVLPSLFLHFVLEFTRKRGSDLSGKVVMALYAPAILFSSLQLSGLITRPYALDIGFSSVHASGYWMFMLWLELCFVGGLILCYRKWMRSPSPRLRKQTMYVLLGVSIPVCIALTADTFSPVFGIESLYLALATTTSMAAAVTYAIVKFELMHLTPESTAEVIVTAMGDLLAVTDEEGYVVFSNKAFQETVANERSALKPMHVAEFIQNGKEILEGARTADDLHVRSLLMGVSYLTKSGSSFPVLLSVSHIRDDGDPVGFVLLANDVTERQELVRLYEETKEKYRSIVESSLDAIVIVQDEKLVYVNPTAVQMFGYGSSLEMTEVQFIETVSPASRPFLKIQKENGVIGEQILQNHEVRGLTKQGKVIDLEMNAITTMWEGTLAVQASFRDVTERKMLEREQALWLWEQETMTKIDRELIAMVDLQKTLAAISQHAKLLTRADLAAVLMVDMAKGFYSWRAMKGNALPFPTRSFQLTSIHRELLKKREMVVMQNSDKDSQYPMDQFPALQEEHLVSCVGFPLYSEDESVGFLVVGYRRLHVFSEREVRLLTSLAEKSSLALTNARLYDNLLHREKDLELLSGARVKAQEDERRRIAREIHDGLGQMLTAIKFNLEILEDTIAPKEDERKRIDDMKNLLDSVMKEARELSYNLMPSVLDDFGLAPALQLLCEQFSQRVEVKILFQAQGSNERLEPALEIGLYRIAQEALNNAVKHAQATEITMRLVRRPEGIQLTIEDNGKGFDVRPSEARIVGQAGMGLVSMRERAMSFSGVLTIDSSPGKGTTIEAQIPLPELEVVQKP